MSSSTWQLTEQDRNKAIGLKGAPAVHQVEKGEIIRFAQAIGDPNPLWNDEAKARKSRYGGLIASPTFLRSLNPPLPELPFHVSYTRLLDGGSEWEYLHPVRPGDTITAVATLQDLSQKETRLGPMLFLTYRIDYTNQSSQLVSIQRNTLIRY